MNRSCECYYEELSRCCKATILHGNVCSQCFKQCTSFCDECEDKKYEQDPMDIYKERLEDEQN